MVLDIETAEMVDFAKPDAARIAIVGTREWTAKGGVLIPGKYRAFSPERVKGTLPLEQLESYLNEFKGIIVGHNILDFDLRILSKMFDVSRLVPKVVDTLVLLYEKNGSYHFGLGLNSLARNNVGKGKVDSGKKIPHLWKTRKYQQVIKYNQRDLELTKDLWFFLNQNKGLHVRFDYHPDGSKKVDLQLEYKELCQLNGLLKQFSAKQIKQCYQSGDKLLQYRKFQCPYKRYLDAQEIRVALEATPRPEVIYHWIFCSPCSRTNFYASEIQRGFADHDQVECRRCNASLGTIRADLGHEYLGSVRGDFGSGSCQGFIPAAILNAVLKQFQNEIGAVQKSGLSDACSICAAAISSTEDCQCSPVTGGKLCDRCWTAGYWQLGLK